MAQLPESWEPIAATLGYKNEKVMLQDLYITQGMSVSMLVKKLGFAQNNVRSHLIANGIQPRSRGGPNSLGKTKLRYLTDVELMEVKVGSIVTLNGGTQFQVLNSTLYKEKRRRGLLPSTYAVIGGKDHSERENLCTSAQSPQSLISTDTQVEATPNSPSPSGVSETLDTSNGIEDVERQEILSS
jgi:hypothetical protein